MIILGIDPGNTHTAFAAIDGNEIICVKYLENSEARQWLATRKLAFNVIVCEMIASYGMAVGKTVFETCVAIGRFQAIAPDMKFITRIQVKSAVCHSGRATDANIRQALIDRYGSPGNKKSPGPTYGISGDMWAALAVATAYSDGATLYEFTK